MHMILRYPSGRLVDGILLAAGPGRLRIVVKRLNETMELYLKHGQWTCENGDSIELEGLFADDNINRATISSVVNYRTSNATH